MAAEVLKMHRRDSRWQLAGGLLVLGALSLGAQEILPVVKPEAAASGDTSTSRVESLTFNIVSADMDDIASPLDVRVRVQAQTVGTLVAMNLHLPPALVEGRTKCVGDQDDGNCVIGDGTNQKEIVSLDKTRVLGVPALSSTEMLRRLFFNSREYACSLTVSYSTLTTSKTLTTEFKLAPAAPLLGVIVGGVIGVFVSITFRGLYRRWKPPTDSKALPRGFYDALAAFAVGVIVVSVVIFLFSFDKELAKKSPVALQVRDWRGGFVLGLFFEPIANWLAGLLSS